MLVIAGSIGALGDAVRTKVNRFVHSFIIALDAVEPSGFNFFITPITEEATKVMSTRANV